MLRLDSRGWEIVLSVHDELVAECDEEFADLDAFTSLMEAAPKWAKGCPIEAEG